MGLDRRVVDFYIGVNYMNIVSFLDFTAFQRHLLLVDLLLIMVVFLVKMMDIKTAITIILFSSLVFYMFFKRREGVKGGIYPFHKTK